MALLYNIYSDIAIATFKKCILGASLVHYAQ